jgi:hypothetical protein
LPKSALLWDRQPSRAVRISTMLQDAIAKASSLAALAEWSQLGNQLRGELVLPTDAAYDDARRVWNGLIDKRPGAIVYCAGADDVAARSVSPASQGCRSPSAAGTQRRR